MEFLVVSHYTLTHQPLCKEPSTPSVHIRITTTVVIIKGCCHKRCWFVSFVSNLHSWKMLCRSQKGSWTISLVTEGKDRDSHEIHRTFFCSSGKPKLMYRWHKIRQWLPRETNHKKADVGNATIEKAYSTTCDHAKKTFRRIGRKLKCWKCSKKLKH